MGVYITIILVLGMTYYVYLDAQKRGRSPKRVLFWVIATYFLPYIGFLIYLLCRPKKIVNDNPTKVPYGFRSKHDWKVAVALVTYFFIIFSSIAIATGPENKGNPKNSPNVLNSLQSNKSATENNKTTDKIDTDNAKAQTTVTSGQKLKVHYIDVGQADCILIQIPNGKNVLIDAGNNADSNTVVSYLQNHGVKRLDVVIGTHPHEDHIGSLDTVINTFDIGQVIMPRKASTTKTYSDVIKAISNKGLKISEAKAGLQLDLGNEVIARLLAPNGTGYEDVNDYSAVLQLVYGKNVFLFDGDASAQSENEMLNAGYNLKADVLKVGHHGSNSATTPAFLSKVNPQYAVISVGQGNTYGHPTQSTLNKLANVGAKVYRTDQSGTVIAQSDGTNITFQVLGTAVQPRAPDQSSSKTATVTPKAVSAPANGNITVYVTNTGHKYHRDGCKYLSRSKIPISLSQAKAEGYEPCKICKPPI